jgi:hypothetical protein
MRAMLGEAFDDPVRADGQRSEHTGPALARRRAPFGAVWLAPLRGRQRRVVRGLGRLTELGFKPGDASSQFRDLCRLCLDPRRLRQHQRDQLFLGELSEFIPVMPCAWAAT